MEQKKIAVLVNPAAGKGRAEWVAEKVTARLCAERITMELHQARWPQQLTDYTDVFLIGGDGTLNFFINAYPFCRIPVSLFAAGSGNDFSWKLNGTKTWEESFDIAMKGLVKKVDAGTCNGRYFINGVGIGFDGQIVKSMGSRRFISAGHLAYLYTVLKKILFYRSTPLVIKIDSNHYRRDVFMISIANGSRYGGGFIVAPQAIINDGLLNVITINQLSMGARLKYLPAIEKGKHLHLSFMHSTTGREVHIESKHTIPAHLDGELMEAAVFDIRILENHFLFRVARS